jgi:hydrogenase/urease accessory protein HupE
MRPRVRFGLCLTLLLLISTAHADVFRPAYLQLKQTGADSYDVLWKVPALDASTTLKVAIVFPAGTEELSARKEIYAAGAAVQRWKIQVAGGLEGKAISFDNLQNTGIDVLVRVERLDGSEQLERILPVAPRFTLEPSPGVWEVVRTYTVLGIEHILLGFDHLLFVFALVMIVRGTRPLLLTITAFTVAHSLTLALATLGIVQVPGPPVEAVIALSIVFVASEILLLRQGRESLTVKKPWLVAFSFGLLHGLGFAGALAEVGLPQNSIPLALLFFNVGVEIGQLLFIAAVLLGFFWLASLAAALTRKYPGFPGLQQRAPAWAAYGIGALASFWVFERTVAFWA